MLMLKHVFISELEIVLHVTLKHV